MGRKNSQAPGRQEGHTAVAALEVVSARLRNLVPRVPVDEPHFRVTHTDHPQAFERQGFQLAPLAQTSEVNIRLNSLEDQIKRPTHPRSHHFLYLVAQESSDVGSATPVS